MKKYRRTIIICLTISAITGGLIGCSSGNKRKENVIEITNVSYDPTRELYEEYNKMFADHWYETTGQEVAVTPSHGGSGSQARSVIEGNEADVVTLALAHDITAIEEAGLIEPGWMTEFDQNSSPYTSTIVFLVRAGNDKDIRDWGDLLKDGVEIITPNPKTSGGACWNFLAAWAYADNLYGGDESAIKQFMHDLYANVTVLDKGARSATTTFVENGQGDVLLAWENEAYLSIKEYPDKYEIVTPSISILAEPSVAIVDEIVKERGTKEVATEYLKYLYSEEAQRLVGRHYYRPSNEKIRNEFKDTFDLQINMVDINDFGGWDQAFDKYFRDGAIFDEIYEN